MSYFFGALLFVFSGYSASWVIALRHPTNKESEIAFWTSVGITFVFSVGFLLLFRDYFAENGSYIHISIYAPIIINGLLMGAISDAIVKGTDNRNEVIRGTSPGIYSDLKNHPGSQTDSPENTQGEKPRGRFNNSGGMHVALSMVSFPAFYMAMCYLYSFIAKPFVRPYVDECLNALTVIAGSALFVCVYFLSRLFFRKMCHSTERLSVMKTDYLVIVASFAFLLFFVFGLRMPQKATSHALQSNFMFLLVTYIIPVAFSASVYTKSVCFLMGKGSTLSSLPAQEISPQSEMPVVPPPHPSAPENLPSIFADD